MPYISDTDKYSVDRIGPTTPGQLNYAITRLLIQYLGGTGITYQTINDILGALEGAKFEFVRRIVNPYEAQKMVENGDVYGF